MRARSSRVLAVVALLGCGCQDEFPPIVAQGEHVAVATELVPEVCAGTLAWLDYTSEYVGEQLGVEPGPRHQVYIVSASQASAYCGAPACVYRDRVVIGVSEDWWDLRDDRRVVAHELTHDYSERMRGRQPAAYFEEGLAGAIEGSPCLPDANVNLDELLEVAKPGELLRGRCSATNFMAWLLETEGVEATLAFHHDVGTSSSAKAVKKAYEKQFGRSLVSDFATHRFDPASARRPYECYAELAPSHPELAHARVLEGSNACGDAKVEDDFLDPTKVMIRWRLDVDADEAGPWQVVGPVTRDVGSAIEVRLDPSGCIAPRDGLSKWLVDGSRRRVWLGPGSYNLSFIADRDVPTSVSTLLAGPCRLGADECGPGYRCDGQICTPEVASPLPLGSECVALGPEFDDPCEAGTRCVGECVALCTSDADCPGSTRCHAEGLCGSDCTGEGTAACPADRRCVVGWDGSASVCLPFGEGAPTSCSTDRDCASGRVCERPQGTVNTINCGIAGCRCTELCEIGGPASQCPEGEVCRLDFDGRRATCTLD